MTRSVRIATETSALPRGKQVRFTFIRSAQPENVPMGRVILERGHLNNGSEAGVKPSRGTTEPGHLRKTLCVRAWPLDRPPHRCTNSMAYIFRFPADVTVLVQEMEGTLCQTLAAHGGTPSARAVKAGLASLPPELTEVAERVADKYGSPAWVPCPHCAGAPWSPGLVVWVLNDWLRGPRTTLEAHSRGVMPPRGEDLIDWLDVIWVDRAGCRADEGASIEALERRRDARLEEMAFQCEPAIS